MLPARIIALRSIMRYYWFVIRYAVINLLNFVGFITKNTRHGRPAISTSNSLLLVRPMSLAAPAEKIQKIVHEISQLNILEVAELNQLLKTTLNIPDAPMMAYGAPAAAGPAAPKEVNFVSK